MTARPRLCACALLLSAPQLCRRAERLQRAPRSRMHAQCTGCGAGRWLQCAKRERCACSSAASAIGRQCVPEVHAQPAIAAENQSSPGCARRLRSDFGGGFAGSSLWLARAHSGRSMYVVLTSANDAAQRGRTLSSLPGACSLTVWRGWHGGLRALCAKRLGCRVHGRLRAFVSKLTVLGRRRLSS